MATFPVMIYTLFSSWRVSYIARNNSAVVLGREFAKQNLFELHHSTNVSDPTSSKWTHSSLPPGFPFTRRVFVRDYKWFQPHAVTLGLD